MNYLRYNTVTSEKLSTLIILYIYYIATQGFLKTRELHITL